MSPDQLDTLEQQRRDADTRYNEALTAFDAALLRVPLAVPSGLVADATPLPAPAGWQAWPVRAVQRWLSPWIDRQHAFNARTADAIDALIARDNQRTAAFEQFQAALIALLQQITAFVEIGRASCRERV